MPGFQGAVQIPYDYNHQKARAAAFKLLPDGAPCARCHHPMDKSSVEIDKRGRRRSGLHFDHNRARNGYLGFSHGAPCPICKRRCNLRDGQAEGGRRATAKRRQRYHPRPWPALHRGTPGPGW